MLIMCARDRVSVPPSSLVTFSLLPALLFHWLCSLIFPSLLSRPLPHSRPLPPPSFIVYELYLSTPPSPDLWGAERGERKKRKTKEQKNQKQTRRIQSKVSANTKIWKNMNKSGRKRKKTQGMQSKVSASLWPVEGTANQHKKQIIKISHNSREACQPNKDPFFYYKKRALSTRNKFSGRHCTPETQRRGQKKKEKRRWRITLTYIHTHTDYINVSYAHTCVCILHINYYI